MDTDWARDQLQRAGYDPMLGGRRMSMGNSVVVLLERLEEMGWSGNDKHTVIDLFTKLAKGQAVAPREVQTVGRWNQFRLGDHPMGVTVRVKADAYEGDAGVLHNGMVGRLVGARNGLAIVQYAESSDGSGSRHEANKLEVLVNR